MKKNKIALIFMVLVFVVGAVIFKDHFLPSPIKLQLDESNPWKKIVEKDSTNWKFYEMLTWRNKLNIDTCLTTKTPSHYVRFMKLSYNTSKDNYQKMVSYEDSTQKLSEKQKANVLNNVGVAKLYLNPITTPFGFMQEMDVYQREIDKNTPVIEQIKKEYFMKSNHQVSKQNEIFCDLIIWEMQYYLLQWGRIPKKKVGKLRKPEWEKITDRFYGLIKEAPFEYIMNSSVYYIARIVKKAALLELYLYDRTDTYNNNKQRWNKLVLITSDAYNKLKETGFFPYPEKFVLLFVISNNVSGLTMGKEKLKKWSGDRDRAEIMLKALSGYERIIEILNEVGGYKETINVFKKRHRNIKVFYKNYK